jgi:hypothetical protein
MYARAFERFLVLQNVNSGTDACRIAEIEASVVDVSVHTIPSTFPRD